MGGGIEAGVERSREYGCVRRKAARFEFSSHARRAVHPDHHYVAWERGHDRVAEAQRRRVVIANTGVCAGSNIVVCKAERVADCSSGGHKLPGGMWLGKTGAESAMTDGEDCGLLEVVSGRGDGEETTDVEDAGVGNGNVRADGTCGEAVGLLRSDVREVFLEHRKAGGPVACGPPRRGIACDAHVELRVGGALGTELDLGDVT